MIELPTYNSDNHLDKSLMYFSQNNTLLKPLKNKKYENYYYYVYSID